MKKVDIEINDGVIMVTLNEKVVTSETLDYLLQYSRLLDKQSTDGLTALNLNLKSIPIIPKSKENQFRRLFVLIYNIGFKEINITATSKILSSQICRLAKDVGLNHVKLSA